MINDNIKKKNILFITMSDFGSLDDHTLYTDLIQCLQKHGNHVWVITPWEKRHCKETKLEHYGDITVIKARTGNLFSSNLIQKAISRASIDTIYFKILNYYCKEINFDLIIYTTPPISILKTVTSFKKRDKARTYLLLKDIFPQNAADLGLIKPGGLLYKYFRYKEKLLYKISDRIGCMSPANCEYVLKHNKEIDSEKIEVCPNSIDILNIQYSDDDKKKIRKKYDIPLDKIVFAYGGNLGKPQGMPFIIKCIDSQKYSDEAYFLIVGSGTEYENLRKYISINKPKNVKLMSYIPKEDYDNLIAGCDVGLIFLDYRFTIPNFPSRLLGYMQAHLPVLACTDKIQILEKL